MQAPDARRLALIDGDGVRVLSPSFDGRIDLGYGYSASAEGHVKVVPFRTQLFHLVGR